jgi:hypothetical protein
VLAFVLADAVYQDRESGKYVIAGTFSRLVAGPLPRALDRTVAIYSSLTGVVGVVRVELQYETEAGESLARSSPLTVTCTDARAVIELGVPVPSLPLPAAGAYRMVLLVDDQRLATLPLDVSDR